jgi:hypothetical protein
VLGITAISFQRFAIVTAVALLAASHTLAQEPAANYAKQEPAAASAPATALSNVLSAACSQSEKEFARTLTARSSEAFARLAPAARISLMKRFVLLDEIGKPTVLSNPSGRPSVRCETPAVTTEMQIGGADLRDNVAFLPMELRDAADPSGESLHRVTMGMVRETGEWKLLSLGLLLLDLPSLELEWDKAEIEPNERAAIASLKSIAEAIESYRKTYTHLPDSLVPLGPPLRGVPTPAAAGLLDSELANGRKNGYAFRYVIVGANASGAPAKYELAATPLLYDRTGLRSFFRDTTGTLHGADRKGAVGSAADSKLE